MRREQMRWKVRKEARKERTRRTPHQTRTQYHPDMHHFHPRRPYLQRNARTSQPKAQSPKPHRMHASFISSHLIPRYLQSVTYTPKIEVGSTLAGHDHDQDRKAVQVSYIPLRCEMRLGDVNRARVRCVPCCLVSHDDWDSAAVEERRSAHNYLCSTFFCWSAHSSFMGVMCGCAAHETRCRGNTICCALRIVSYSPPPSRLVKIHIQSPIQVIPNLLRRSHRTASIDTDKINPPCMILNPGTSESCAPPGLSNQQSPSYVGLRIPSSSHEIGDTGTGRKPVLILGISG
ncbi:hypothetical protein FPV67DRAFT_721669 [Lyophyllum atratum]|nr:hypothetical protein FPV67DRAFT_721669 [Lyophyllum atratum]